MLDKIQSEFELHPTELSQLVHQAMQRCFVGALLKFGFRLFPPCRTGSQVLRSSPVNLKNVASKQKRQPKSHGTGLEEREHGVPSVLANVAVPCASVEGHTVLGILKGFLENIHPTTPCTPDVTSRPAEGPSQPYEQSVFPSSLRSERERRLQLPQTRLCSQGSPSRDGAGELSPVDCSCPNPAVSPIHCSGRTGLAVLTSPLVLTCDSDVSLSNRCSTPSDSGKLSGLCFPQREEEESLSNHRSASGDGGDWCTPHARRRTSQSCPSQSDRKTNCPESSAYETQEYQGSLSLSEGVDAFLADVLGSESESRAEDSSSKNQFQGGTGPNASMPHEGDDDDHGDANDSNGIGVFKHETTAFSEERKYLNNEEMGAAEGFFEFSDLPSSEDLDAFLAEMEYDEDGAPDDEDNDSDVISKQGAASQKTDVFDEPIELADFPSPENLEALLAEIEYDLFAEENVCAPWNSPKEAGRRSMQSAPQCSAPGHSSRTNKTDKNDERGAVSKGGANEYRVECGLTPSEDITCCQTKNAVVMGAIHIDHRLQPACAPKHSSLSVYSCDTPVGATTDTNKVNRARKRTHGSRRSPGNLRVALLRKLNDDTRGDSFSSTTLSPSNALGGRPSSDASCGSPGQRVDVDAFSEEHFAEGSWESSPRSLYARDNSIRSTSSDVDKVAQELDASSTAGLDPRRSSRATESDELTTSQETDSYSCEVASKAESLSCFESPELFSSSPTTYESSPNTYDRSFPRTFDDSPNLFSPVGEKSGSASDNSCDASSSILLFSSQSSLSFSIGGHASPTDNAKRGHGCHSSPALDSRRKSNPASSQSGDALRTCSRSKGAVSESSAFSETGPMDSPLMFSQLSNSRLTNSLDCAE